MQIREIRLSALRLPLAKPYARSYRTDHFFDPLLVEIHDGDGRSGYGEAIINPGYTHETPEGAWDFLRERCASIVGQTPQAAKALLLSEVENNPNAVALVVSALEMLEGTPILQIEKNTRVPLLQSLSANEPAAVANEVDAIVAQGFRTIKVKVGFGVERDLAIVGAAQKAAAGRAVLRLDANRGFSREDGCRFAAALEPNGIMLFEQPCESYDWDANAAVAAVSTVPLMLDESIYGLADVDRAASVRGVGFVKLKLKKAGGVERLKSALLHIRALGMSPVLGDGVATELSCWMEACVARLTIDNAGEMNGFLRPTVHLFRNPLPFEQGDVVLPAGYVPELDDGVIARHRVAEQRYAPTVVPAALS
jgi:L-alanine-DL-glutamate epimerase-like enolase superfamily enzyme